MKDRPMLDDQTMQMLWAGRSCDEQVDDVRTRCTHGLHSILHRHLLEALSWGVGPRKERAETIVMFGCYNPYAFPDEIRSYLTLLDRLDIDFTFALKEYCCGLPMIEGAKNSQEDEQAERASKEFMAMNMSLAEEVGAKRIAWFCVWCTHLGRHFFPDGPVSHVFYPDIVLEKMGSQALRIEPAVVGWFEGCHKRNRLWAPDVKLNWRGYRDLLSRIEGLKVLDVPNYCCVDHPTRILDKAESLNLGTIVCACAPCEKRLQAAAGQRPVRIMLLTDLLLIAMGGAVTRKI